MPRAPFAIAYGLPVPLVSGWVAVALPGPVFGDDSPGPAVTPVLPEPLGLTTAPEEGEVVAPPTAEPDVVPTDELEPVAPARALRMQVSRSVPLIASQRRRSAFLSPGAAGSPADWGLGTPPVGPVPTALAPD